MPAPPWSGPHGIDAVLAEWQASGAIQRCLAAERSVAPREGRFAPVPPDLTPGLASALAARGVASLYSHQREAIDAARSGRHVVVATPTASGKSLCFHVPVLDALARDPAATALYLYPTKALSRDQEHGLLELTREAGLALPGAVFDGDTPGDARRAARERSRMVLTNPDMLHAGILPSHARWASLFQGLRYVVLDELHTYRGVFGSHLSHVLGRLKRIAAFHGSSPRF
ncbi:MAG TPA: DEAD/DEAH box helicase, partial [Polyangiaceae bacterium]|nr:DEAD/DEAH box helicase [Polyangiaceae bacterium]